MRGSGKVTKRALSLYDIAMLCHKDAFQAVYFPGRRRGRSPAGFA